MDMLSIPDADRPLYDEATLMTVHELGAGIAELEGLPYVERARQAAALYDVAMRLLPKVRATALYSATRERGALVRVAKELGMRPDTLSKAIVALTKEGSTPY